MVACLSPSAQEISGEERSQPGAMLMGLEGDPGVVREGGGEDRRQGAGVSDHLAPGGEAVALIPGWIVDERRLFPRQPGVGEEATGASDQGVDAGELGCESIIHIFKILLRVDVVVRRRG